MLTRGDTERLILALEKLADAQTRIAEVLTDESKIGGSFDALCRTATAIAALAVEVSALPGGKIT